MLQIEDFDVILLDVQKTFMFDGDRFGATEDFHATYRLLGGEDLSPGTVNTAIRACFNYLNLRYNDLEWLDCFPPLEEALKDSNPALSLPQKETDLLQVTFASHECGRVPEQYTDCLKQLAKTHRLGVISNIWAKKDAWLHEFEQKGILDIFETLIFSSDYHSIKPSPVLFREAMAAFDTSSEKIVFVGDSPAHDVAGAKAAGIKSILTTNSAFAKQAFDPEPDHVIPTILHLLKQYKRFS